MTRLVFIDRDDTLVVKPKDASDAFRLVPHVLPALLRLRDAGFGLVLVTCDALLPPRHDVVLELLASQGIEFAGVHVCTHPAAVGCLCRKPHLGLVRPYLTNGLELEGSAVVGTSDIDAAFAQNLGVTLFRLDAATSWPKIAHTLVTKPRQAQTKRTTRETDIEVAVDLDAQEPIRVHTGLAFFDHMLEQLAKHGGFSLVLTAHGDLAVEAHHTVEDSALALGETLRRALGDKRGIGRYGFVLPMDEAQASATLDLAGRAYLVFDGTFARPQVGDLPTEMVPHFFRSLCDALGATLHVQTRGDNTHHVIEAAFKAVGRCLRTALQRHGGDIPSTKGVL